MWWVLLGQPSLLWLLIAVGLSTFVVLRWWARGSEYLLDKETDGFYRNGKMLGQLAAIKHVRIEEEEEKY